MAVIMTLTPILDSGNEIIAPRAPAPTTDDPNNEIDNPLALPFVFDTTGVACRVREELSASTFTAGRLRAPAAVETTGGGASRLTLEGAVDMQAYLTPIAGGNIAAITYAAADHPFHQLRHWLRNQNTVQASSPYAYMQIYRDEWALERLDLNYEQTDRFGYPLALNWRLLLTR